jgi:hypothetical protein
MNYTYIKLLESRARTRPKVLRLYRQLLKECKKFEQQVDPIAGSL